MQKPALRMITTLPLRLTFMCAVAALTAYSTDKGPVGMYCGGNQMIQNADIIFAAKLEGNVFDPSGAAIAHATIQIQKHDSEQMVVDTKADDKGHFSVNNLPPGRYWLGVSSYGFNLHIWDIQIKRRAGQKRLTVTLSLGT